jgi:hypothetical protein
MEGSHSTRTPVSCRALAAVRRGEKEENGGRALTPGCARHGGEEWTVGNG